MKFDYLYLFINLHNIKIYFWQSTFVLIVCITVCVWIALNAYWMVESSPLSRQTSVKKNVTRRVSNLVRLARSQSLTGHRQRCVQNTKCCVQFIMTNIIILIKSEFDTKILLNSWLIFFISDYCIFHKFLKLWTSLIHIFGHLI